MGASVASDDGVPFAVAGSLGDTEGIRSGTPHSEGSADKWGEAGETLMGGKAISSSEGGAVSGRGVLSDIAPPIEGDFESLCSSAVDVASRIAER